MEGLGAVNKKDPNSLQSVIHNVYVEINMEIGLMPCGGKKGIETDLEMAQMLDLTRSLKQPL